jgi:hypothetical protein
VRIVGMAPKIGPYAVACEKCGAKAGWMCQGGRGWPKNNVQPHAARLAQSRAKEALEHEGKK